MQKYKVKSFIYIYIKTCLFLIVLFSSFFMVSCSNEDEKYNNMLLKYENTVVLQSANSQISVYNAKGSALSKIGNIPVTSEFSFNSKNKIYAFLLKKSNGKNMVNNNIVVFNKEKQTVLKDFYSAVDLKMSPSGKRIAFRNFKKDSFDSVQQLKVYNIFKSKYEKFDSNILMSGNIYDFINDDEICYYGVMPGDVSHNKIYLYDFSSKKETSFFNDVKGYCTYLKAIGSDSIFYLDKENESSSLYLYNHKERNNIRISGDFSDIYEAVYNTGDKSIYFTGKNNGSDALFKYSIVDNALERLTYDFPSVVDKNGGIGISKDGVYFCGATDNDNVIYFYSFKDSTVNLIANEKGYYKVFLSK